MGLLDSWQDERIESAVELLLRAAEDTGCLNNPTWSIAELGMSAPDLDRLLGVANRNVSSWSHILRREFHFMAREIRLPERLGTLRPSGRECLGLLVLALLAELSRRHGSTEACFRPCRRKLEPELEGLLFQGGSLHRFVQAAIVQASERFRMRLAGPEHSVQRWYLTVRMHEGFPGNNLENRLPSWLHGLGVPLHLELLLSNGPLGSTSVQQLWSRLSSFARGKSPRDGVRLFLESSVWFRGQDVDGLLQAIEEYQPPSHGTSSVFLGGGPIDEREEELEVEMPVSLRLAPGPRPGLLARPDPAALCMDLPGNRYEVLVEGRWQGALLRDGNGGWAWTEEGWLVVPFRSTCAVQLLDEEDRPLEGERSLRVLPEEGVIVLDSSGNLAKGALDSSQGYWLIAPANASWRGAPAGAYATAREDRCLLWLPPGWGPEVELHLEDELLWSPGRLRLERPAWLDLVELEENPKIPGEFEVLVPYSAQLEAVRVGGKTLALLQERRFRLPELTDPLVDVRLILRSASGRWWVSRRVVARAALLLCGEDGSWRESAPGEVLDLETLTSTTVRVCAPGNLQGLYFDHALGRRVPQRAGVLTGFPGRGEALQLGPLSPGQTEDFRPLQVSVVNHGLVCGGALHPGRLTLELRRKIRLRKEHRVLLWRGTDPPLLCPVSESGSSIEVEIPAGVRGVRAAALLYRETWLGSWWQQDWHADLAPTREQAVEFFLWLRWLRLPFLEEKAAGIVRKLAAGYPAEALLAWSILPREHDGDDEGRKERLRRWMQLQVQGGTLTPAGLPEGEAWRQAVRLLLLETEFPVAEVETMYSRVHVETLHHPIAQALLPWGTALLGVSGRWPDRKSVV